MDNNIYSFEDFAHAKICCEDLNYIGRGFATRKFFSELHRYAYGINGVEELAQILKLFVSFAAKDLETTINSYCDYVGIKSTSFKEKYNNTINKLNTYINTIKTQEINNRSYDNIDPPIEKIISILRNCIRECDRICEFNATMLRTVSQTAPRFNKVNTESMVEIGFFFNENDYRGINIKDEKYKNSFNDDYTREISKKMKSMKNYIISLVKKYFGAETIYKEFDIENKVIS